MSRSVEHDDRDLLQDDLAKRSVNGSQGRLGSGSESGADKRRNEQSERARGGDSGEASKGQFSDLASVIDEAAANKPTLAEFIQRLERRGVGVVPSIQSDGRLNGFSFRWKGRTIKGSSIGRAYSAKGLQQRKGVSYDPGRDNDALARAAEQAGLRRPFLSREGRDLRTDDPSDRMFHRKERERNGQAGLSRKQEATLAEIGRFRTVAVDDVIHHEYGGRYNDLQQDVRVLQAKGFVERHTIQRQSSGKEYTVLVLTRKGRNHAKRLQNAHSSEETAQRFYNGFVKPAEIKHDVGIYRMYQVEANQIEGQGGTVRRVVLDYELKQKVYAELNKKGDFGSGEYTRRKQEIAEQNGLHVVDGKVVFPDLRIEYETRDEEPEKVDLELASDQYKTAEVQQKRAAGLKIYGPDSAPRCPALEDPEIVAGLISM